VAPHVADANRSIWQNLLLQASQDQDFVRHAIVAIGGLSRSMKMRGLEGMEEESSSNLNAARLHGFALEHYGRLILIPICWIYLGELGAWEQFQEPWWLYAGSRDSS